MKRCGKSVQKTGTHYSLWLNERTVNERGSRSFVRPPGLFSLLYGAF